MKHFFGRLGIAFGLLLFVALLFGTLAAYQGQNFSGVTITGALPAGSNTIGNVALTDGTNIVTACISAYGSAPTGTECPATNAFITNNVAVTVSPSTGAGNALSASSQSALTTAVVVKGGAGGLYGFQVTNSAASVCYLEFINAASAPSLGTAATYSFAVPASGTLTLQPGSYSMSAYATGISVGMATTYNGSSACAAATAVIFYK
jgi:hypothetical protein